MVHCATKMACIPWQCIVFAFRPMRKVAKLIDEWEILQRNSFILLIQIISICLVSFAAPFRLGKSVVEIRDR